MSEALKKAGDFDGELTMSEALKKADDLYRKSLSAVDDGELQTIRDGFKKDATCYIIPIGQARELDHKYYQVDKYAPLLLSEPFHFPKIGDIVKGSTVVTAGLLTFTIDL